MKYHPAIVVVAFNRPRSISRLLHSLSGAIGLQDVELVISIDNNDGKNKDILEIANKYHWPYGPKEVIYHPKRLGLKQHVLKCGDLTKQYGSAIILEDDLFVSPYFYEYAVEALEFYGKDPNIGGISLYNQPRNELAQWPFIPLMDDSDVYFLQFPSSLGQAWTSDQWVAFKKWFKQGTDITTIVHRNMNRWPETSWKKHFCAYLIQNHKYFVFPRTSLTTNFNDPGTNLKRIDNYDGQVQLRVFNGPFRFKKFIYSNCVYDTVLELLPRCAKALEPSLTDYDFEFDLYGIKEMSDIKTPFVITTKPSKKPIRSFRRALRPHEMNVLLSNPGEDITLCRTEDVLAFENSYVRKISDYKYHYTKRNLGWKVQLYSYIQRIRKNHIR